MGELSRRARARGLALNVAQLVGHGTVRAAVKGIEPGPGDARRDRRRWPIWCAPRSTRARSASPPASAMRPGVFADHRRADRRHRAAAASAAASTPRTRAATSRSTVATTPDQPPTNLLALDETAAVWRAHGVKVQHSHLIFVGDRTWPTTDRVARALRRACATRASTSPATRFPTSAATRRWSSSCRRGRSTSCTRAVTDPEHARSSVAGTLNWVLPSLGMRWEDTQILWVPKRELGALRGHDDRRDRARARQPIRPRPISIWSASSAARRAS